MTLVVLTAATFRDLTTVAAVKARLGISGTAEDTFLAAEITRQTGLVLQYLNVQRAQDGTRTLAREVLREAVRPGVPSHRLRLARKPVTAIASITEDDVAIEAADFEWDAPAGILNRFNGEYAAAWTARKIVVEYTAGWLLPADPSPDLPPEFEAAVIEMVKAARAARSRDPMLRSFNVPDVVAESYLDPRAEMEGLPPAAVAMLPPKDSFGPM